MRQCYSCMQFVPGDRAQVCPHCGQPLEWSCDTTRFLSPGSLLQNKFVVGKVLVQVVLAILILGGTESCNAR